MLKKVDLVMFYTLCLYSACYEYDTGSLKYNTYCMRFVMFSPFNDRNVQIVILILPP